MFNVASGLGKLKGEALALTFGMLVVLVTFEDSHLAYQVGNLDLIFGLAFWKILEVVYPVASVVVFLLYAKEKQSLRIDLRAALIFLSYLVVLSLICLDDIGLLLNVPINPPVEYWIITEWTYPFYAIVAFFLFGKTAGPKKTKPNNYVTLN